ncbi:MAG TPA: L-glutamate gamma-semialdehyde dehydrogenase [Candidatus Saccharimonadales bacterium]|nr:L-glutamate gamma-semialdehyde dehydrogenase [Candidatus Saccharimonadales bacterium]
MVSEFHNEPLTDFTHPDNVAAQEAALQLVEARLGRTYPLVIGGRRISGGPTFDSLNPSAPRQVVGRFAQATVEQAGEAVGAAHQAFESWRWLPCAERAAVLFRMAALLRRHRFEMNAWMILEVGKSWREADGDTAEAVDFCEFYAREALRYGADQPVTPIPGEANQLVYIPIGVVAVIPPWNFPCAILTGMTGAALVTGNTVVLKPSSDSPAIAWRVFELFEEAGVPPGALNFLTGGGGTAGNAVVADPRTRAVAFTGSRDVGLHINELAAKTPKGQLWIKRVVAEMGGKGFILVDREADLEAAAEGVTAAAFGFQGQKCSACSRAIVHQDVYDEFLKLLLPRVRALPQGPVRNPAHHQGPVINAKAEQTILGYIEQGRKEGRLLAGGAKASGDGYFIQPTVIADVAPGAVIEQEEIFGPVLAVIRARDFDHGVEIANDTEYGLTGAVYSRNRATLARARRLCHAGNLYLNRECTGALVGGHPFGGFNMSGTDSKAGGRDYLLLFLQAKAISEAV